MRASKHSLGPGFSLIILLLQFSSVLIAQTKPAPAAAAPVPAQILAAKKVFVANAGAEEWSYSDGPVKDGPDRAYNEFYAALKAWGRYELVPAPADADLVIEIQFTIPPVSHQLDMDSISAQDSVVYDPQFRLTIHDPNTNVLLWGRIEHMQWAVLGGNRERNFEQALEKVVGNLRALAGSSTASSSAAQP
jgi:hypothetical protein